MVCGLPIVEYHHMDPWAEVGEHEAENITLLCDLHHKEATGAKPLLTDAQVRRANKRPHNLRVGESRPHMLHFEGPDCRCHVGSVEIVSPGGQDFNAVVIDGRPILGFRLEDGIYLLQFQYVDANNKTLLTIIDNELVFGSGLWDFEWTANRLVIRDAPRQVILEIEFQPPGTVIVRRGDMYLNGARIKIAGDLVDVGGGLLSNVGLVGSYTGLVIGHDPTHRTAGGTFSNEYPVRLSGYEYAEASACHRCKIERGEVEATWHGLPSATEA